ncbi:MAG: sigma-54-dependent Fis family transcriptional regulator [Sandaracinaceae bacterium]|nr:sigma-54-dependent Fis family transcriptional regulator [Sandaracinaceae bacterium]
MSDSLGFEDPWRRGALDDALAALSSAEPRTAATCRELARVRMAQESPQGALELLEEALRHAGDHDDTAEAARVRARRAEVQQWLGQSGAAMDEARAVLDDRGAPPDARAVACRTLGRVAASARDTDGALQRYDEAVGWLRDVEPSSETMAVTYLDAAETLLDRDGPVDSSAAAARLADARDHIDASGQERLRPRLGLLLGRARGATGDPDGAISELQRWIDGARDPGRDIGWQLHAAVARLHEQRGAEFLARKSWERSVEVLESLATALAREHREGFWEDARRRHVRRRASGETERPVVPPAGVDPFADGRLARLLEVLKRLASETDLDRLLERITDCAIELSGAERGFVLLTGEDGNLLPHTVRDAANPEDPHVAFSRSIAEAVLIDGEAILTVDARNDHRLSEYVSVHKLMLKSVACLPIRGRSGTVGVLYLEHRMRRGRFGDTDLDLLLAFADQAAIALENARLLGSLESRRTELEDANVELAAAKAEIERLLDAKTAELEEARTDLVRARDALRKAHDRHGIVGRSERMRRVFAIIDRVSDAAVPVVIQGESGTGKELIARAIHFSGGRSRESFVAVNCAAIPEALLESELFGHVRGAFTGADRDRMGVLVKASGGTLFLDEVGDMPPKMQIDLLRVLQERRLSPVGSDEEIEVDVRVIAASNKSLARLVERGEFREDLYYRLNVVELWLPPLRERADDIPLLCDHFLATFAKRDDVPAKRISREAVTRLVAHPLPGNVRQLEHLLLNAWVMAEGDVIDADDLALGDDGAPLPVPPRLERALSQAAPSAAGVTPPGSIDEFKDTEKLRILEALEAHAWNRVRAAKELGMARRTFYRRLKEYGIL